MKAKEIDEAPENAWKNKPMLDLNKQNTVLQKANPISAAAQWQAREIIRCSDIRDISVCVTTLRDVHK